MKYYLDTNTIIYSIKGTYPNIVEHFKMTPKESIVIPQIVIAEIEYGAQKSSNYEKTIKKYNDFTCNFDVAYFDKKAAEAYGVIRSQLEREGKLIGPNDLIIASIVVANKGVLVTHNVNEFERIKDIQVEDWTK